MGDSMSDFILAFAQNQRDEVRDLNGRAGALAAQPGIKQQTFLLTTSGLRKFSPRECERLQGFPDDWTRWTAHEEAELSVTTRYHMTGNAVAVPVAHWLGSQLLRVHLET